MKFKVGDVVTFTGTITEITYEGDVYPYRVGSPSDQIGAWLSEQDLQPGQPTTGPTPDYCLGFADGYDYANEDNPSLLVFGAVSDDYRKGWRGGYVHGRAEQDASNLAIVDGGM